MKKVVSILVLLITVFGLTSCSLSSLFKKAPESNLLTGILLEQPIDDQYAGSHLLMDENGNVVSTLRSLTINLSSIKYLNNKIQVTGKVNADDGVFEVDGISVLEVIDPTKSNREFKEYLNTDLGFKLKYYSDWKMEETGNMVTFTAPSENEATDLDKVVITQSPFQFSLPEPEVAAENVEGTNASEIAEPTTAVDMTKEALLAYANENKLVNPESLLRKIGIDLMDSLKVDGSGDNVDYFLYRSGFIYKISFIASKTTPVAENKNIFNEMIAEFQFMGFTMNDNGDVEKVSEPDKTNSTEDQSSTESIEIAPVNPADMTSFESSIYQFSAQYPKDWYYAGVKGSGDVLHHYGFSDKSLEDTSTVELIGMDVLASSHSDSQSMDGSNFVVYVNVGGRSYKLFGASQYKDTISAMAKSIVSIKTETPQAN